MTFKTVFDPRFKYRRADFTDVRLTFARIRRAQRNAQRRAEAEAPSNVVGRIAPAATVPATQSGTPEWPIPAKVVASSRNG